MPVGGGAREPERGHVFLRLPCGDLALGHVKGTLISIQEEQAQPALLIHTHPYPHPPREDEDVCEAALGAAEEDVSVVRQTSD